MKYLLAILLALWAIQVFAAENVLFMVDISGSMTYRLPGIGQAIRDQAGSPALKDGQMDLVGFSGCGKQHVHYWVPMGKNNMDAVKEGTKKLQPTGAEDIVAALNLAKDVINQLIKESNECARVVLFTDDEDTCNPGKPHLAMLKDIAKMCEEKKQKFTVDVVTSTVDEGVKLFVDEIAEATGGKVFNAGSVDEITEVVKKITEETTRRATGTPLTSKSSKPEPTTGNTKPPATTLPQPKQLPARQGGGEKKKEEK